TSTGDPVRQYPRERPFRSHGRGSYRGDRRPGRGGCRGLGLLSNYPNPFNGGTVIRFFLPRTTYATLAIYDLAGQRVAEPLRRQLGAGDHVVTWDGRDRQGRDLAAGPYWCRLVAGSLAQTRAMLLLR
ncbi:MAG: FlgD immunoglobulin-like domain containing protein, partial [Candidatus Latescibacterota bacterium]